MCSNLIPSAMECKSIVHVVQKMIKIASLWALLAHNGFLFHEPNLNCKNATSSISKLWTITFGWIKDQFFFNRNENFYNSQLNHFITFISLVAPLWFILLHGSLLFSLVGSYESVPIMGLFFLFCFCFTSHAECQFFLWFNPVPYMLLQQCTFGRW